MKPHTGNGVLEIGSENQSRGATPENASGNY
jgi:hypothetical protein